MKKKVGMHGIYEKSWLTADFASTYSDDETEKKAKMSRQGKTTCLLLAFAGVGSKLDLPRRCLTFLPAYLLIYLPPPSSHHIAKSYNNGYSQQVLLYF